MQCASKLRGDGDIRHEIHSKKNCEKCKLEAGGRNLRCMHLHTNTIPLCETTNEPNHFIVRNSLAVELGWQVAVALHHFGIGVLSCVL